MRKYKRKKINNTDIESQKISKTVKLLYGANDPLIRYATGFLFSDPVFVLDYGGKRNVYLDDRELDICKKSNKKLNLRVVSILQFIKKALQNKDKTAFVNKIALSLIQSVHLPQIKIIVSESFSIGIANYLKSKNFSLTLVTELYPERQIKNKKEILIITSILKRMRKAFVRVEEILVASKIDGNKILYRGKTLTSEFLKYEIDLIFLKNGLLRTTSNIVSGGKDSAIPHASGSGLLRPYQSIVVDLFPKDEKTGYFGDMTRTYCKGIPNEELRIMNDTVLDAQKKALDKIKAGQKGSDIHQAAKEVFENAGFETKNGEGFIHATGHGLGLDIHEKPALSSSHELLKEGNVVTVEPGLYYKKIGGIRIEDVVLVKKNGYKNLTNYPKKFVIL